MRLSFYRPITRAARLAFLAALALFAGSLSIAVTASQAATTAPAGFFGLGGWGYPTTAQAATLGSAGVENYRAGLVWNDVERQQGTRNWGDVDRLVTNASDNGYNVLLVLNGCAQWACGATRVAPAPGPQLDAYNAFVTAAVQRYGRQGSFWTAHPSLAHPTVSWQVWNEVNVGADWPHPSAVAYATFLKSVGGTIKAADPQATVVASGLTEYPGDSTGEPGAQFLSELYDQPGFSQSFDVAAVHAYAEDTAGSVRVLDSMRKVMIDHGDPGRPMWVTEMGWASAGPSHPFVRDAAGQAAEMQKSFNTLVGCRSRWNLDRVIWFSLQDANPASLGEPEYWGMHTGLLNSDGTPKPDFATFKQFSSGQPLDDQAGTCALPGGTTLDVTMPDTTITSSPALLGIGQNAPVTFTASKAAHFECSMDSSGWTPCAMSVPAATNREGTHEIRVRAIDAQGNVDPSPAYATWMVDLSAPDTRLTKRPAALTTAATVGVGFTGVDAVGTRSFRCSSDNGTWKPCASPFTTPKLAAGRHSVAIRAIDDAGNTQVSPTVVNFTTKVATKVTKKASTCSVKHPTSKKKLSAKAKKAAAATCARQAKARAKAAARAKARAKAAARAKATSASRAVTLRS